MSASDSSGFRLLQNLRIPSDVVRTYQAYQGSGRSWSVGSARTEQLLVNQ
jgi:hypothetical protein